MKDLSFKISLLISLISIVLTTSITVLIVGMPITKPVITTFDTSLQNKDVLEQQTQPKPITCKDFQNITYGDFEVPGESRYKLGTKIVEGMIVTRTTAPTWGGYGDPTDLDSQTIPTSTTYSLRFKKNDYTTELFDQFANFPNKSFLSFEDNQQVILLGLGARIPEGGEFFSRAEMSEETRAKILNIADTGQLVALQLTFGYVQPIATTGFTYACAINVLS